MVADNVGPVELDPNTGWPVELDYSQGPDAVPYGRYRRCPDCRGSGAVRGVPCGPCKGVPYVDGTNPDHWCTVCLGRPQSVQSNSMPTRVFCAGPSSDRDSLNREVAYAARTLAHQLEDLSENINDGTDDPVVTLDIHEKLYLMAAQLYARGMEDPQLDPIQYQHYVGRRFPAFDGRAER